MDRARDGEKEVFLEVIQGRGVGLAKNKKSEAEKRVQWIRVNVKGPILNGYRYAQNSQAFLTE